METKDTMDTQESMDIETLFVHGGTEGDPKTGAVIVPIFQTSTYEQDAPGVNRGYEYTRSGNPTRKSLEDLIAKLENGYAGFAFGSGMAAITAVLSLFRTGDKIVISDNVYGGTFRVLDQVFDHFGITYEMTDTSDNETLEQVLKQEDVAALLIESPANPLLTVTDLRKASNLAHKYGKMSIVDNTFMTPYLQRPLDLGADIVLHSATKFLGGHSDVVAGLVVVSTKELADKIWFIQNSTGGVLGPFDSFLMERGIKTLSVRMDRHVENAEKIAKFLEDNEGIKHVYYPGLPGHPGYEINRSQAKNGGAVISFELEDGYDVKAFFKSLRLITLAESLGGVESLICHPASMTHACIPEDIRNKVGITYGLIRLSVGIESAGDLIADLDQAITNSRKGGIK